MTINLAPTPVDGPVAAGPKGDYGLRIRGAYTTGMSFYKDDLVTRFNSVWIANVNTTVAPTFNDAGGSASPDWTLALDGRGTELASDAAAAAAAEAAAAAGSKAALDAKWGGVLSAHPTNDASGAAVQNGLAYYSTSASRLFARVAGSFTALVNAILTVSGAPSSGTGYDGDFAIDPTARMLYSKAGGAWTGVSLAGDQQGPPAFRNRLINGNFDVWQRGTSFTVPSMSAANLADRWLIWNGSGNSQTVSRQAAPSGFRGEYACRLQATSLAAAEQLAFIQRIESGMVGDLDGLNTVVSFDVLGTTTAGSLSGFVHLTTNTAKDNGTYSASSTLYSFTVAAGASRVSIALSAADAANLKYGTQLQIIFAQNTSTGAVDISIGAVQFEADPSGAGEASDFEFRPPSVEQAMCQRYYQRNPWLYGLVVTSSSISVNWNPLVMMRTTPTVALLTSSPRIENLPWVVGYNGSGSTLDASHVLSADGGGDIRIFGFSGLTVGSIASLRERMIEFSAEL